MSLDFNKIKKFAYSDILGWSVSRYDKFQSCKRQYYYDYYGKFDVEFSRTKIDSLKAMTSVSLVVGVVVHDVIKKYLEKLLKSEAKIVTGAIFEQAEIGTIEQCKTKVFAEVYYKETVAIDAEYVCRVVEKSLSNFVKSDRFEWLTLKAITNKKGWVIEPLGYGETRIDNLKAYCKVDFLFPVEDKMYILDWKTGKPDLIKHKKQLVGYATWVTYHFNANPEMIVPIAVYLQPDYNEMSVVVTQDDVNFFVKTVKSEIQEMYAYCGNIEKNIPKGKTEFLKTDNKAICRFCNYRELCW